MSQILIEKAVVNDAQDVGNILSGWVDKTPWMPRIHSHVDEQNFVRDLIARGWVYVAKIGGQIVGFLARDKAELHALYLTHKACGQGIGRVLLDGAKAQTNRLQLWVFESNIGAQRFYRREGFREIGRSDGSTNDENLPDIRYEWRRQYG